MCGGGCGIGPVPVAAVREAALGVSLGAGELATDTRMDSGGASGGAVVNTSPDFDFSKHPYAWLIVLALVVIMARKVIA